MPQTTYHIEELIALHGGRMVKVGHNRYLLPTGARVAYNTLGYGGQFNDPPADPLQRLPLQMEYCRALLAKATQDFAALKAVLTGEDEHGDPYEGTFKWDAAEYGPDPRDGTKALLAIKAVARRHRQALARLEQEYGALPAIKEQRELEASLAEARALVRRRELSQGQAARGVQL